jgi:hypothetical protein
MSLHTSRIWFTRSGRKALASSEASTPSAGSNGAKRGRRRLLPAAVTALVLLVAPASAFALGAPALSGSVSDPALLAGATSVAISGNIAYTTDYAAGQVTAVDISNPSAPKIVGESTTQTYLMNASTINIANGYAYVVSKNRNQAKGTNMNDDGSGNSLTILDIHTNPTTPTIVGHLTDALNYFGAYGVAVSGGNAFIAAQGCLASQPCPNSLVGNSFSVVNVSTPSAPVAGVTLHNSALPAPWTGTNALDHADSVAVAGNFAYVTSSYSNKFTVIDISNPAVPTIVASFSDPAINFPVDVAVSGNFAYVANQGSTPPQLTVVDISTPASPKVVGSVNNAFLNGAYRVRIHGNFAYVSGSSANAVGAIDISDPTNPRFVAGLADMSHFNHTTGLDVDNTGHLIVTSPFLSSETFSLYPPFPTPTGPLFATGTVSAITLDPVAVGVRITGSSEPPPITGQTSANFAFVTNDSVASMQCQLDAAPLGLCTSATNQQYTGLANGPHTFTVQATDAAGNVVAANYSWTINAGGAANTSPPTVSGSPVQGQVLSSAPGTWIGTPPPTTFTYQWQRCTGGVCTAIPTGSTGATYTLTAADVGFTIDVVVTGSNNLGTDHATSAQTAVVTSPPPPPPPPAPAPPSPPVSHAPVNTAPATISGFSLDGQKLTASPGTWTGTPAPTFTYQWRRCNKTGANCVAIAGATSSTLTLTKADEGFTLDVVVTATNSAGSSSSTSGPSSLVPTATTRPTVNIKKLAVKKVHGRYVVQVTLSNAATVTVTLKRLRPHKATLKHFSRKERGGSNKITLQSLPSGHHAVYTLTVTVPRSGAGTATATSRSITFTVK